MAIGVIIFFEFLSNWFNLQHFFCEFNLLTGCFLDIGSLSYLTLFLSHFVLFLNFLLNLFGCLSIGNIVFNLDLDGRFHDAILTLLASEVFGVW